MSRAVRNVQMPLLNKGKAARGFGKSKVPKLQDENTKRQSLPRKSKPTFGQSTAGGKRKADSQLEHKASKKRSAFGDITNAIGKTFNVGKKKAMVVDDEDDELEAIMPEMLLQLPNSSRQLDSFEEHAESEALDPEETEAVLKDVFSRFNDSLCTPDQSVDEISSENHIESNKENIPPAPTDADIIIPTPEGIEDYDKALLQEPIAAALYARDIFNYFRTREKDFVVPDYSELQPYVSSSMRAVLVDWMVEVQESYELNHETLYMAVRLVDMHMSRTEIARDDLQLLGCACLYIASKFDERLPPFVDDFLYICDDAYTKAMLLQMERVVLKSIGFDLGFPLSYRFLRRFARCTKATMERLTLARFILEKSLLHVEFSRVSESLKAAASLVLAAKLQDTDDDSWSPTLQYYSSLKIKDVTPVAQSLHKMLLEPVAENLQTIDTKYSHELFFCVASYHIPSELSW